MVSSPTPTATFFVTARAAVEAWTEYRDPLGRFVLSLPPGLQGYAAGTERGVRVAYAAPYKCALEITEKENAPEYSPSEQHPGMLWTIYGLVHLHKAEPSTIETGAGTIAGWSFPLPDLYGGAPYRARGFGGRLSENGRDWVIEASCVIGAYEGLEIARAMLRTWRLSHR